ncbi:hypothetical protein JG688_00011038 [Phytophthora aleatoria]|uniref:Uncharacterized protein n=1 Tax=Phytophthora aleatoria TaxID=2496075 RepID=A0A8J5J4F4_9STRA|nr:hypothetical protein JG688_00011038 [Phytophthora aleatoria]
MSTDEHLSMMDEAELDVQQKEVEEVVDMESSEPGLLRREQVTKRLSILGRNPFTQAHIYTTATLTGLHLSDIDAISEFPHIQHIPLLLTLDAAENQLTEVLDFKVPKCCLDNAWVDGARWIGSLLRKATLDKNQIVSMPRHELANLSHNRLTSVRGLVGDEDPRGLQALETLLLGHNQLTAIDSGRLELAHNNVGDINELNCLASLRYLGQMSLHGNPLVEAQVSRVFYRGRVLRRLLQLEKLDDEQVTSKEKVKALVMHGSDLEARRQVAAKYLPGQEFTDFLPPLNFEDDEQLELPLYRAPSLDEPTVNLQG